MQKKKKPKLELYSKLSTFLLVLTTTISCSNEIDDKKESLEINPKNTGETARIVDKTITTNLTQSGGSDINYLRGMALGGNGGFVDTNQNPKDVMALMKTHNFRAINGIRNL